MMELVVINLGDPWFGHNNNVQRTVLVPWMKVLVRDRPESAFGPVALYRVANTTTSHHRYTVMADRGALNRGTREGFPRNGHIHDD